MKANIFKAHHTFATQGNALSELSHHLDKNHVVSVPIQKCDVIKVFQNALVVLLEEISANMWRLTLKAEKRKYGIKDHQPETVLILLRL
jgi:hypothetical protein